VGGQKPAVDVPKYDAPTGKLMIISHNRFYKNKGRNKDGSVSSDRQPALGGFALVNRCSATRCFTVIHPRRELLWVNDSLIIAHYRWC
ncbi:MAG TPA: hypothetical protein VLC91_06360, partial [Spongiibacteraceae bacterium]|nr:hypothetical protein [Spongiibacteraceae bacterium]